jgi:hypothetical protein
VAVEEAVAVTISTQVIAEETVEGDGFTATRQYWIELNLILLLRSHGGTYSFE